MSFEGEFASYEPLRRVLESEKVKALQARFIVRERLEEDESWEKNIITPADVISSKLQPDLIVAIDGSNLTVKAENGFPGAEIGYITVASVLIDLVKVRHCAKEEFIHPKAFRDTEKASTIESVFPGCNVILDNEKNAKASFRRAVYEELQANVVFNDGETLLDTYHHLFQLKQQLFPNAPLPESPIDGVENRMTYGLGEYKCPISGEALFSTDALRLHELMRDSGTNGELFGQLMSTLEKLWLIHILRAFERKGWLDTLRRVAFIMDGPLAVFSTANWLTRVIQAELTRINMLQKKVNNQDLLIIGLEKSGMFYNHFIDIDTTKDGITDKFPRQSALLLDDSYIKKNIIYSESTVPYGDSTYFGRKFLYKTASGQRIVPVVACYNEEQRSMLTALPEQFVRLGDVMSLLDQIVSNRYPDSVTPLISAHAEAAIPLNIGRRVFDDIAREMRGHAIPG